MTPMEAALKWMELQVCENIKQLKVFNFNAKQRIVTEMYFPQELYPDRTLVSPATGHADTEWFDEFWLQCQILGCR